MADAVPPLLLFVVGPPAVGKMSVGQAVAERTGLRLFHNHIAIELALRYFDYGTQAFRRIDGAIRRLVIEEVAASDLPGLVFTFVWAFNLPGSRHSLTSVRGRSVSAARACCSSNWRRPRRSG